MPRFEDLHNRYRDDGLEIIGLNSVEDDATIGAFVAANGVSHPVARVADSTGYNFSTFSTCYALDGTGTVIWVGGFSAISDSLVESWLNSGKPQKGDSEESSGCVVIAAEQAQTGCLGWPVVFGLFAILAWLGRVRIRETAQGIRHESLSAGAIKVNCTNVPNNCGAPSCTP
ncbi:MAG: hypothetical protein KDB90_13040 [Planctomycetes bacterium]|nr:hypothetical protein [Planctomycetota bacterium]